MKKKIIFVSSLIFLLLFSVGRYVENCFIFESTIESYSTDYLLLIIIVSAIVSFIYFIWFRKIFPKGWSGQNSIGKIAVFMIFPLLSFAVIRGSFITLSLLLPFKAKEFYKGVLLSKAIDVTSRGTKFYSFQLQSLSTGSEDQLSMPKGIYINYEIGDTLAKEVLTGLFDIKYMYE